MKRPPRNRPKGLHYYAHKNGKIYYSMLHPETKKRVSLGNDYGIACGVLHQIKAEYRTDRERDILNRINGKNDTLSAFIEKHYWKETERRNLAENTVKGRVSLVKEISANFGNMRLREITTRSISEYINSVAERGTYSRASAIRTQFIDLFRIAISSGWIDATHNPAQLTVSPAVAIKRSRLSIDQFRQIYDAARPGFERNMLELAILTTHAGTAELTVMKKPVDGFLWIERQKTKERVKIPLWITVDELGFNLAETVEKCSIDQTEFLLWKFWKGKHRQTNQAQLSRAFKNAARRAGIDWGDKDPASLYECRSLAIRLHDAQGDVDPQSLAAHKDAASTNIYRDTRNNEWTEVQVLNTKNLQKPYKQG